MHAFEAHSGTRVDYELLLRFPSRKNEDYNHHDVGFRRVWKEEFDKDDKYRMD